MKVLLARNAGFCMGVRRAVDTTLDTVQREDDGIATYGPLIHNPQVLQLLQERGVTVLNDIPAQHDGTVIIRAHGVPPDKKKELQAIGAQVKDATCPRVVKVQVIIDKYRQQGCKTVIIGDSNHAEVEGLMGHAGPDVQVVSSLAEVAALTLDGPYIIVSQTTQNESSFEEISSAIVARFPQGRVFNTICDSTHKRQEEVRRLSKQVDAMVVVGGRSSANTARLGEIAADMGCPVFMVESEDDLDLAAISQYEVVGVTAGASTPSWMINWVVRVLEGQPSRKDGRLLPLAYRLFWLLLATNIYVSLSAGLLSYAATWFMGIDYDWRYGLIAACYIFAMHNLNRFSDQRARKINDPLRARFYQRYRLPLLVFSLAALALALYLCRDLGPTAFWLLGGMSLLGVLYSVRFIPRFVRPIIKFRRMQEIPGSKTLFIALAWAMVAVGLPIFDPAAGGGAELWLVVLLVFLMTYVRCALFDVFDMQGDRIVGKETLPVFIGEKKTMRILHGLLVIQAGMVLLLPAVGWLSPMTWILLAGVAYLAVIARLYEKRRIKQGLVLEFWLESVFPVLAITAWLGGQVLQ